jgi:hypothetical protein
LRSGEMAAEMRLPVGAVSHHVRWLASHDCIELVRTAQRRGAVESDVLDAKAAGTLTADDVHLTRSLLTVDDRGHSQLTDLLLLQLLLQALEIEAQERTLARPTSMPHRQSSSRRGVRSNGIAEPTGGFRAHQGRARRG